MSKKQQEDKSKKKEIFSLANLGQILPADEEQSKEKTQDTLPAKQAKNVRKQQAKAIDVSKQVRHIPQDRIACAPYNFIPLNTVVVPADTCPGQDPTFDRYHADKYTGWIELVIEALTPLYVRDSLNQAEMQRTKDAEQNKHRYIVSDFFSPQGEPAIPGSTLRGMIRNMVEIASFGKFGFFDDKRLYFRGLADQSNLRREYQQKMSSYDRSSRKSTYHMSAGLLQKKGLGYFIGPAAHYEQIPKAKARSLVSSLAGRCYTPFQFYEFPTGYLVVSGDMQNKKKDWWIDIPKPDEKLISVPDNVVLDYRNDKNCNSVDLLELAQKHPAGVPCFYVTGEQGAITSFGHTGMFRVAYDKTISEHIPQELRDPDFLDIAGAIFGNEKTFAGRIFVEDARLAAEQKDVLQHEAVPKILSSPKPTTFQHYLVQTSDQLRDLSHYNGDTSIRGNKWYWHNENAATQWQDTEIALDSVGISDTQHTKIKPVKAGTRFVGRIRFENLSAVELGALLFVLNLPQGCAHKMGMGKPLGLGSVKITSALYLTNRDERYKHLLTEWQKDSVKSATPQEIVQLCEKFEKYVLSQAKENTATLWGTERLQQFKQLLTMKHGKSPSQIRYMLLEEFRNRRVLPWPEDVDEK
jgi:CRISPR/Cas system CSM-associated protein Csm3 (group 7 of RAMP superfamily)